MVVVDFVCCTFEDDALDVNVLFFFFISFLFVSGVQCACSERWRWWRSARFWGTAAEARGCYRLILYSTGDLLKPHNIWSQFSP